MFTGTYYNQVDEKGRLNFPARLRTDMGESFVVTCWMDECLVAFPDTMWDTVSEKLGELPLAASRQIRRFLYSNAEVAKPDKQGRIVLSAALRQHAGIEKEAVVIGVGTHAEIWSRDMHEGMSAQFDKQKLEELMEQLNF